MLEVSFVRAFSDNYIWLIHGPRDRARVAVVDPGDAAPVMEHLQSTGLVPDCILVTHHHGDHVGGVRTLVEHYVLPVHGPATERIPCRNHPHAGGDHARLETLGLDFEVLDIPGHTSGHIAYHGHGALFCGDTLFSAGCGRLFEGTPAQMTESLSRLMSLPPETRVYCGHEYTLANLRFAATVEPANPAVGAAMEETRAVRAENRPSLPSTLAREAEINPFLRFREAAVRRSAETHAGRSLEDPVAVFAEIRAWKDNF